MNQKINKPEYKTCRICGNQYPNNTEFFQLRKGKLNTTCRQCQHEYNSKYHKHYRKKEHETSRAEMVSLVIKVCRVMQEERDIESAKDRRKKWLEWRKKNGAQESERRKHSS